MQPRSHSSGLSIAALFIATFSMGCADKIGDACETALDCSSTGSRECDRTQKGGYCTIRGCEKGTCPDEAVCVKFRPQEARLATTYCMFKCGGNGDCRGGYRCLSGNTFGAGDGQDALVLDGASKKFCAIPPALYTPDVEVDAGASFPEDDAGIE